MDDAARATFPKACSSGPRSCIRETSCRPGPGYFCIYNDFKVIELTCFLKKGVGQASPCSGAFFALCKANDNAVLLDYSSSCEASERALMSRISASSPNCLAQRTTSMGSATVTW